MKLSLLVSAILLPGLTMSTTTPIDTTGSDHLSYHSIVVQHATLKCKRTFNETRTALEAALPPIDWSYRDNLAAGDIAGATAALEALPPLSIFTIKNHGALVAIYDLQKKALLYEIGNPLTASQMTRYKLQAAFYAPVRVLLLEYEDGRVMFEWDRPASTFGRFGDPDVDVTARGLDERLRKALESAAGW